MMEVKARGLAAILSFAAWLFAFANLYLAPIAPESQFVLILACLIVFFEVLAFGVAVHKAVTSAWAKQKGTVGSTVTAVMLAVTAGLGVAIIVIIAKSKDIVVIVVVVMESLVAGSVIYAPLYLMPVSAADAKSQDGEVCGSEQSGGNDLEGGSRDGNFRNIEGQEKELSVTAFVLMMAAMATVRATHTTRNSVEGSVEGGNGGNNGDHNDKCLIDERGSGTFAASDMLPRDYSQ